MMEKEGKILVIDDEPGICQAVQRILAREGFLIEAAFDGQTGLDAVRRVLPDLVLIDVRIPDISGLDLISLIHAVDPQIVCIIITGYATVEMAVEAIKEGAYDFLTKPFSADTLVLAVNQGLERRMLILEAQRAAQAEQESHRLREEKARLEELNQAKAQFIRLVTHELKAPVSAVENYLKLILEGYVPPEREEEILRKCIARTEEERSLIADLLELGQLEVLDFPAAEPASLYEVLLEVLEEPRERAESRGLEVLLAADPDVPRVAAPREQLRSLWGNLISNAIKYTPDGGQINISLVSENDRIIGRVADTGIGISKEDQAKLFTEFFRAKNARAGSWPGTGLGLAIVKKIVERLGGSLSVSSKLGAGSTFEFSIPLVRE